MRSSASRGSDAIAVARASPRTRSTRRRRDGSVGEVSPRAHLPERGDDDIERRREDRGGDEGLLGGNGGSGRTGGDGNVNSCSSRQLGTRARGRGADEASRDGFRPGWRSYACAVAPRVARNTSRLPLPAPSTGRRACSAAPGEWRGATSSDFSPTPGSAHMRDGKKSLSRVLTFVKKKSHIFLFRVMGTHAQVLFCHFPPGLVSTRTSKERKLRSSSPRNLVV